MRRRNAVDDLRRELRHATKRQARAGRHGARRFVPMAVVLLALGLTGAAVAAVGGSVLGSAPDSPDDTPVHARTMTAPGKFTPMTRDDLARLRRERKRSEPVLDARRYFSALGPPTRAFKTIYRSGRASVAIRATDREVCIRYRRAPRGGSSGSCAPTAIARHDGVYVFSQCFKDAPHPQHRVFAGVVPDGVAVVQGKRDGVVQATAAVRHNGFVLVTDQPLDTFTVGRQDRALPPIVC